MIVIRSVGTNVDTAAITEAWHDPRHWPGAMCHGPQDRICVVDVVKGHPVLILDSTSIPFHLNHTVQTGMEGHHSILYAQTADLLLITSHTAGIIRAVSCFTDKPIWEVTGEVDGLRCDPHDLVYSSQHDVVFVCDGLNRRLLVLEPMSGKCVQTIDLSQHVAVAWNPHLYEDQLILYHSKDKKPKLSYYTVSIDAYFTESQKCYISKYFKIKEALSSQISILCEFFVQDASNYSCVIYTCTTAQYTYNVINIFMIDRMVDIFHMYFYFI